jgi:nitrogenase molybdenum-iron protein alpha/beta subunit/MoaA/NifB/PqqE/SkfB family radical SAM enzyme
MATHYNEPVDIASSSLTEEGAVFGGEANLLKGLKNLIDLYEPEVIGVCTTCLAETIGEDVGAIVKKFYAQNPDANVKIISVASPGYGGTQNEGWFAALRSILEQTEQDAAPNGRINVVTPMISPADTRWLKGFLTETGLEYILLPDLSENLDGATEARYKRLKKGGAPIFDIAKMAGAWLTIEFSEFVDEKQSPAAYLRDTYGVPCLRLPLPVGVRGTNRLIEALASAGGTISEETENVRGRYLDAMADAHKYCAKARAAIFGEPDFVAAVTRLCCENGVLPVLAATGSVSPKLRKALAAETETCLAFRFEDEISILDDSDFTAIERVCRERGVNLLIGSSDGRRIAHKLNLPLIRCAFPIHDHVGGQRVRMLGFEGSLNLLDQMANAVLERIETRFRGELYDRFFRAGAEGREGPAPGPVAAGRVAGPAAAHPCFDENARKNARLHLPVAPECNIQCNYCLRRFDCVNESRPGVSSEILTPAEAFERYVTMKDALPNLTTVGIAGPGDALANFDKTHETLRLIREYDPDVVLCVATNGLLLPQCVPELTALRVSHVTVTVNAIDPAIEAKICNHICYMGETYTGEEGAAILMASRLAGIAMLRAAGIACKVNCVALKGVNDAHIPAVAKKAAELGAVMTNIMPHIPVKGSAFEDLERLTPGEIAALRTLCGAHIKQMTHCRQCRADAAGTIGEDLPAGLREAVVRTARPAEGSAPGVYFLNSGRCDMQAHDDADGAVRAVVTGR